MSESWALDELAHAGPEHLDESFIEGYDRKQGHPDPGEDLAAFEAHGLGAASVVVDLAAGTGQFAIPAARRFGRVIAIDVSPAMVAALREKAAAAGLPACPARAPGSSATPTTGRRPMASTPGTRCTSCRISGRASRCGASRTCSAPAECSGCGT